MATQRALMNQHIMVTEIKSNGTTLAILIRGTYQEEGIQFFTPEEYSQQLAFIIILPTRMFALDFNCIFRRKSATFRSNSVEIPRVFGHHSEAIRPLLRAFSATSSGGPLRVLRRQISGQIRYAYLGTPDTILFVRPSRRGKKDMREVI